jgi:hypothetical protein
VTLVAELEPNTAVGACSDETVVDFPRTEAAPELAWSLDDEPWPQAHSWRPVWIAAALLIVLGVVAGIAVYNWPAREHAQPVPAVVAPPPPPPTSTVKPLPTKDDLFIATLERDQGVPFDRSKALPAAQWVCAQLAQGQDLPQVARRIKAGNPDQTDAQTTDFAGLSVHFYCPQYEEK